MSGSQRYVPPHRRGESRAGGDSVSRILSSQANYHSHRSSQHVQPLAVTDFQATFLQHAKVDWGAAEYQVHTPNCRCNRVTNLCGRFNNLIVAAKRDAIDAVYVCQGTDTKAYERDARSCEMKLASELFRLDNNAPREIKANVSCASCLLTNAKAKNGFVAIMSQSSAGLEVTIQSARNSATSKQQASTLSSRHGHFTIAVNVSTLLSFQDEPDDHLQAIVEVVKQALMDMKRGGADVSTGANDMVSSSSSAVKVKLGHHLSYLLESIQRQPDECILQDGGKLKYVMLFGYVDEPTRSCSRFTIQLDLPGGKRHLGESTLECAIRKADKECSLKIDKEWMASRVARKFGGVLANDDSSSSDGVVKVIAPKGKEGVNVYFVMTPPPVQCSLEDIWDCHSLGENEDSAGCEDYENIL